MTPTEFKNEFDLLYNNIMSDMAPGLDDYEISLFLTQAQEELVQQLYSGSGSFAGFEANERVRRNLANLLHTNTITVTTPNKYGNYFVYSIDIANNILHIISERVEIGSLSCCNPEDNKKWVNVAPVKYDEINKVLENPFRRPNNRQVLRMDEGTNRVKIISKASVYKYEYDWLQKPSPIIVSDLPAGFSINGVSTAQTSTLDESLHRPIIKYAVQLAAASWASNNKN